MPRGDATGPSGMGPMSGRGAGYCAGYNQPGFRTAGSWYGLGRRRGGGRRMWGSFNMGPYAGSRWPSVGMPMNPENERHFWQQQADMLKQQLMDVQSRIDNLKDRSENAE